MTGVPNLPNVTAVTVGVEPVLNEVVETVLIILVTASSAAFFYAWADDSFPFASDKNLFSVSNFKLAA